jgi:hypothetical protein
MEPRPASNRAQPDELSLTSLENASASSYRKSDSKPKVGSTGAANRPTTLISRRVDMPTFATTARAFEIGNRQLEIGNPLVYRSRPAGISRQATENDRCFNLT